MRSSALYFGDVMHARMKPRRHLLRYRVYSLLLDLDEVPLLGRTLRIFSHNRFNLFSFHDRDHGAGEAGGLKQYVERQLAEAGIDLARGTVRLLCSPRILNYAFNPLSVYFCYHADGRLVAILYEVNNTFGERHSYLIPVDPDQIGMIRQSCAKEFYVSPFIEMAMTYHFRITPPAETVAIKIREDDKEGTLLHATLTAKRHDLSDRALFWAFFAYPLLTMKVILGIHWEALRLWLKGVRLHAHPLPPIDPVTIVTRNGH
jgi:DUF1365 family protein